MKKTIAALLLGAGLAAGAFAGSTKIAITPPQVTSLTIGGNTATGSTLDPLNAQITAGFKTVENTINNGQLSNFHDLTLLSKGFANANAAAFDNASLLGYQTYDLFAVMLGFDLGIVVPSFDPTGAVSAVNDIATKGDIEAGLATGGFAGQAGLNLGFLVPNLYATAKLGFIPSMPINGVSYQQGMFGIGANYTLFPQIDVLFGFIKWRGLSVGTGFTFNSNSINMDVPITAPAPATLNSVNLGAPYGTVSGLTAEASNVKAKLSVSNSSFVIPIDLMTSIQALWFLNFGVGVGCDLSFSSSNIKLAGASDLAVKGLTGAEMTKGTVALQATDSTGGGDFFMPRIAASVGLNLAVLKLDMPVSYYPLSKAFAIGFSGGIVW